MVTHTTWRSLSRSWTMRPNFPESEQPQFNGITRDDAANIAGWGCELAARLRAGTNLPDSLRSANLGLWLATTAEGRVAAGAVMCCAGGHAVYWHGAARESLLPQRPMNLLFSELIRQTRAAGYRWFDFNPSAGMEGVRRFKEGFGARPLPCPIVSVG